jgi:hypothetical protein
MGSGFRSQPLHLMDEITATEATDEPRMTFVSPVIDSFVDAQRGRAR